MLGCQSRTVAAEGIRFKSLSVPLESTEWESRTIVYEKSESDGIEEKQAFHSEPSVVDLS